MKLYAQKTLILIMGLMGFECQSVEKTPFTFSDKSMALNNDPSPVISKEELFFDAKRNRQVPVIIYQPPKSDQKIAPKVVLISHGYGAKNTEYSFIANALAAHGYVVVSIQHDLDTDEPLPTTGNLFERRSPMWEKGVQNIEFVLNELQKNDLLLDLSKVILIGHSNGGDMSMMFAGRFPQKVSKIISLDSRRYPFPRNENIKILRFGASDDEPDEGVVPEVGVQVVYVKDAKHIDLCDRGSEEVKEAVNEKILSFLTE